MTTLYINDEEVTVPAGTSILEACRGNEVNVPYFCYHPELSVAANCRMCLVEIEGWNKPAASCCTPVAEGMRVRTHTDGLKKDRQMVMEYLLIHHPLDCPVCDQGGSCKLQDYSMAYGLGNGRYVESKRAVVNYELGPFVSTCMTRCIHCTRCVRFADEIAGTGDMGVLNRGDHMTIAGIVEDTLSSELSGNLADVCPVGALLDKPSNDVSRPWEVVRHKSTCIQCPNGCDISIESRGNEVIRIRPLPGGVEPWICDRGRYVYDAFRSDQRILVPKMRVDGNLIEVNWDEAIGRAMELLKGKRVGIVCSPGWSAEGLTSIRLLRDAAFPDAKVACDLYRRDFRPFAFEEGFAMTVEQIESSDQVVILGSDLRQRLPILMQRLRKRLHQGKPVTRIGAMNYRTNTDKLTNDALIRPRDWPAVIARAMEQVKEFGKTAAGMDVWIAAVNARHEAGKLLADALLAGTCALLVGEEIRSHPDAAALIHGLDLLMRACGHAEAGSDGRNLIPEGMNAQVLGPIFGDVRIGAGELFTSAAEGELDALLVVGSDPVGDGLFPVEAKAALARVPLVQVGSIAGAISAHAEVLLPAAAYSEIEGHFVNMEGRVREARTPLVSVGQERPLWKVMMRLTQAAGCEVPAVNLEEIQAHVDRLMPELGKAVDAEIIDAYLAPARRNPKASSLPAYKPSHDLDVVSRFSMYREGMWARASTLLTEAADLHPIGAVVANPQTLAALKLKEGRLTMVTDRGEFPCEVCTRDDVSPGVVFVAKGGACGDLCSADSVSLKGEGT
jgi:NADH-quinone oxidoreductase subunit G